MGIYKDEINVVAHDFNSTTVTIKNGDDIFNVQGIDALSVVVDEDRATVSAVADGMALHNLNPITTGVVTITVLEASPTTDKLWTVKSDDGEIEITVIDSNAPNLAAGGKRFRLMKAPELKRENEGDKVVWTFNAPYVKVKGGSYSLSS